MGGGGLILAKNNTALSRNGDGGYLGSFFKMLHTKLSYLIAIS